LAHVLLILALAWGLRWKKEAQDMAVEAELWSATAHTAAPQAVRVPPPPAPVAPVTPPPPAPVPEPKPAPQVDNNSAREAELALEQQKQHEEQQRQAEQARLQAQQLAEQQRQRQEAAAAQAKAAQQEADRQALAKAKADKKKADEQKAQAANWQRRMTALAAADQVGMANTVVNGPGKTSGGNASRDAGPSAGYAARVRARVYPNITYLDLNTIRGNPEADVEVHALSDGTIVDRRLVKSSGVPSWDDAVLRAIDKTQTLPRDVDGRVPSPIIIGFRPH
jgi:colicin import membrane protein